MVRRCVLASVLWLVGCAYGEPLDPFDTGAGAGAATGGTSGAGGDGGESTSSGASGSSGPSSGGNAGAGGGGAGAGTASGGGSCGDGVVAPGEECDDQNDVDGDGCTSCVIDCAADELKNAATGHCYRRFAASSTQPVAEANCQAWGGAPGLGHLVSIENATENAFVAPLVASSTWIGADDFGGDWAWIDGTPFAFENWQDGEPNYPGIEHCMFMDAEAKWHDHNCGDTRSGYLCERRGAGTF
jgi:cysteine-rich repeat protein